MRDEEAEEAYGELSKILRERQLGWLVDGVARQIAEGKTTEKTVSVPRDFVLDDWDQPAVVGRRRSVPTKFLTQEPFGPRERLRLLTDAVDHVLVASAYMAANIAASTRASVIQFVEETPEEPITISTLSAVETESHRAAALELRTALQKLAAEADRAG